MPFIPTVEHRERTAYDPSAEEPVYGFQHAFKHTSEGGSDIWIVTDRYRGAGDPVATCYAPEDALNIADALNAHQAR